MQRRRPRAPGACAGLLAGALAAAQAPAAHAQAFDLGRVLRNAVGAALSPCSSYLEWVRTPMPAAPAAPAASRPNLRERVRWFDDRALFLVSDEVFVKRFGKPYEQLTVQDLREFQRAAPQCHHEGGFTPQEWETVRTLWDANRHALTVKSLAAERAQANERQQELARAMADLDAVRQELARAAADGATLDRLRALRDRGKALLPKVPAEQRAAYEQTAQQALQEAAPAAMRRQAREALAEATSADALPKLIALRRQLQLRNEFGVTLADGDPVIVEMLKREQQLGTAAADAERQALRALPDGLPGLEGGVRWQRAFMSRWGPARDLVQPELMRVFDQDFLQRREPLLARLQPALLAEVAKAPTIAEAQGIVRRYTTPNEARSDTVQALEQAVTARVAQIERAEALGRPVVAGGSDARAPAPEAARPTSGRATAPATAVAAAAAPSAAPAAPPGEPSEDVMFDMVRQKFEATAERMRGLYAQCSGGYSNNPLNAVTCLGLNLGNAATGGAAARPVKILRFAKIGCEKSPSRPGYNCEYEIKTDNPLTRQYESMLGFKVDEAGFGQARFVRNREGLWLMITGE